MPYFKLYVRDWLADFHLRGVSLAARGLWADMLCLAWQSDRRGYLEENGEPMTPAQLVRRIGAKLPEVKPLLAELERAGIFSRTNSGAIYSRRIVEDENKTAQARRWGKRGGNPTLTPSLNPTLNLETGAAGLSLEPRTQNPDLDTHTIKRELAPALEVVKAEAARIGQTEKQAERFVAYWQARDWTDKAGKPLTKWQSAFKTWTPRGSERSSGTGKPRSTERTPRQREGWQIEKDVALVKRERAKIWKRIDDDTRRRTGAFSDDEVRAQWRRYAKPEDVTAYEAAQARVKELEAELARCATRPAK